MTHLFMLEQYIDAETDVKIKVRLEISIAWLCYHTVQLNLTV